MESSTAVPIERGSLETAIAAARAAERMGLWPEALAHFERALWLVPRAGDPVQAARILRWIGYIHLHQESFEVAEELFLASLAVAEANAFPHETAAALIALANIEYHLGRYDGAEPLYQRARTLAADSGDTLTCAIAEMNLGILANIHGDSHGALGYYRRALDGYRSMGAAQKVAQALVNMSISHRELEEWDEAEGCLNEAALLVEQLGDAQMESIVATNRADLLLQARRLGGAEEWCRRSLETATRLGNKGRIANAHRLFGVLYREMHDPESADLHLTVALELARAAGARLIEAEVESERSLLYLQMNRKREALVALRAANEIFAVLRAERAVRDVERRLDRVEEVSLQIVQHWAESIEAKDLYTAGHCQRVANYACMLAQELGITGRELRWFRMGAFLHDVGKVEVPAEVLNKPGKLNSDEWELMRRHTTVGDEVVAGLDFPWDIRPMVRSHHERWDGEGYPDRLRGEDIPLHARILCLADVFDALTSTRSYKAALSREEALQIMEQETGKAFDPSLFPKFREIILDQPG